eukprot:7386566-Prymnesium_polylepis.1
MWTLGPTAKAPARWGGPASALPFQHAVAGRGVVHESRVHARSTDEKERDAQPARPQDHEERGRGARPEPLCLKRQARRCGCRTKTWRRASICEFIDNFIV